MEEWKSLESIDFPNYMGSTYGRLKNRFDRIIKGSLHGGYYRTGIVNNKNQTKSVLIHTLIARIFLGPPPDDTYTVDHIDGNRINNHVTNLRWASPKEQRMNQKREGKRRSSKPITQMASDGTEIFTWLKIRDASAFLGLSHTNLSKVCKNGNSLGGYKWKYCLDDIPGEIWKEISSEEFEPVSVSNKGRYYKHTSEKIGFGFDNHAGYKLINLKFSNKKKKARFLHDLIAQAFLGETPENCIVNHKDGNKKNNKVENLEYITYSENTKHAYDSGLVKNKINKGNSVPINQLSLEGEFIATFPSAKEANRKLGISTSNISSVCNGNRPNAGGYKWEFANK
jgi:hypothetical protein